MSASEADGNADKTGHWPRRWWHWILIALALLILVLAILVWAFSWDWLHGPAERILSEQTGRKVQIGAISGEKTLRPRIVVKEIHIANAEWGREPELLAAEKVEVVVSLPELLRGRTVLPEIHLIKPKLSLERRKDGASNWTFGAEEAADAAAPDERDEMPLIGLLVIDEGVLIYRDEKAELDINSKISTAVGDGSEGREELRLTGRGNLRGEPFTLNVRGGSLLALREGEEPYPLTIEMIAGETRARISGTLDDPIKFEGTDLDVLLAGPDMGLLTRLTSVPVPATPRYELKGRLQRDGPIWIIESLNGKVGQSDLSGRVSLDIGGERLRIEADLKSKRLDYRDIGPLIGIKDEPKPSPAARQQRSSDAQEAPQGRTQQASAPPPRVLPDAPLATQQIRETDAKVRFHGDKVEAPGVPLTAVDLTLDMQDGVLHIHPLRLGISGGFLNADIRIDAKRDPVRTDYDIRLRRFDLQRVLAELGLPDAGRGQIEGRIGMSGTGDTIRKSLGSANGDIRLSMNEGALSNLALELVGIDIQEAAGFWAAGDKTVPIRCFVVDLQIRDGIIAPQIFVLDTTDTTVTADGRVSLKDEQLGLTLSAHPKDPSLFSARTPITVKGPFSRPAVGVEAAPLGARVAGAIALGVLLTPLASILAFIEPGLEQDSDCTALLHEQEQKQRR
ncbi:AsmA family protein [uncultured Ferrovibrio sp.]|jgi:uncharacterized protein involved in outer membrane biogenesis|uniref:AsmA family protein n=1 Tax=uncultured Ferrovibrio sp. TaxID=1576913 RepID=UPI0026106CE9|nr:AsmA family protein [uncultured Ferrovibrio sp.]